MAFHPILSLKKRLARLRTKPVIANRFGAIWNLHPSDWIDNRIYIGREFETEQLAFAQKCIEDRALYIFFDCGSNIGLYSVLMAKRVATLETVHAFEPVPATWARLKTNLGLNKLLSRVTAHNYGLGDIAGTAEIALDPKSTGTATLSSQEKANPKRDFVHMEMIDIRVFDSEFEAAGQRAFFKIDVEGHEIQALTGMRRYLRANDCVLQVEAWDDNQHELIAFMAPLGYREFHRIGPDIYFEKA